MRRVRFDRLHTVRLESESRNGHTEICQEPDGTRWVKLCVNSPACQREILNALDEDISVRLEHDVLELLLPWYNGISLRQWLYERTPTLGQRRDACLSLLEQQVEMQKKLPPCLTVLAASTENLTIENTSVYLQYIPKFRCWEPDMDKGQAVCAIASVICEILTPEQSTWFHRQLPAELQLLRRRQRDYTDWSQLQRDVSAVPDELPLIKPAWISYMRQIQNWLSHYGKYIMRITAALLLAAALLSLTLAYRQRRNGNETVWQGMPQVGDQDLRNEEGGE